MPLGNRVEVSKTVGNWLRVATLSARSDAGFYNIATKQVDIIDL